MTASLKEARGKMLACGGPLIRRETSIGDFDNICPATPDHGAPILEGKNQFDEHRGDVQSFEQSALGDLPTNAH